MKMRKKGGGRVRTGQADWRGWQEVGKALVRSVRAAPLKAAASIVLSLFSSAQSAVMAILLAWLTDDVAAARWNDALRVGAGLSALLGVGVLVTWTAYGFRAVVEDLTLLKVDELLLSGVSSRPDLRPFEDPELQGQLALLRRDRMRLGNILVVVVTLLSGCAQLVLTVVLLARVNPTLGLVPAIGVVPLLLSRRAERLRQRAMAQAAHSDQLAAEWARIGTSSLLAPELVITGMAQVAQELHAEMDDCSTRIRHDAERGAVITILLGNSVFALGFLAALAVAAIGAATGSGSVGNVVLVAALSSQVGGEISLISSMASALRTAQSVAVQFRQFRMPDPEAEPGTAPPPEGLAEGISLRGLTFRYPGSRADALNGITLDLRPGQTVALVGSNGAGKTTLVKLLCLLYKPSPGSILVGGQSLDDINPGQWRTHLTAAFQDAARFNLSAQWAIGIGDLERLDDRAAVSRALAAAGVAELADALPHGLDTELGDLSQEAVQLSGGQWQQLALARAMMRTAPWVVFLDEPTSALDVGTETRLLSAFAAAAKSTVGRSAIGLMVTHRLAAARIADRVVLLRDGRVAEDGTHDELIARGDEYAAMFAAQARGYE
jgi:ATP-binding cassette subfamily B protein